MSLEWEARVIGINYYPPYTSLNKLTAAARDAESIATQLENYGYETFRVKRLPHKSNLKGEWKVDAEEGVKAIELKTAITNLFNPPASSKPLEMALFFFSGHGWRKTVNGQEEVFLATSDVLPEEDIYGVALSWLGEQLQSSPVQKLIIWLDCCYSGELLKYLDKIAPDKDYCLITATRSYEEGIEISYDNGLFTKALIEELNADNDPDGFVDSQKLARRIQQRMAQTAQAPQVACSKRTIPLTTNIDKPDFENTCPYRALYFFTEKPKDTLVFHGRTKLTEQLVKKVHNKERLIAVFGQSGSGKSSLLRAGLLYQLKLGQMISGSNNWNYFNPIIPSSNPLERLAEAIKNKVEEREDNCPLILIIDQFEECFTMCTEATRKAFIEQIQTLLVKLPSLQIILGIRSDFRSRLREYPQFAAQMSKFNVEHLSREEIREAIEKPAQRVGLLIQGELKQQLINDVEDYPGSLPLFQYTLTELWKKMRAQQEIFLRLETYQELGGIEGTLEKRADEVYASLFNIVTIKFWIILLKMNYLAGILFLSEFPKRKQQVAKRIFLELTQIGELPDRRRRVSLGRLVNSHHSYELLDEVAHILANPENRLITRTGDSLVKDAAKNHPATVILDVVHDALIRHWGQLRKWQEQYRDGMIVERKIEDATEEWLSKEKNCDYLLQGDRLAVAELYLKNYGNWGMLNGIGEEFITESQNLRTKQEQEQERRRQEELDNLEARRKAEELARIEAEKRAGEQKKANKKLRIRSTVAVSCAVAAGIFGVAAGIFGIRVTLMSNIDLLKERAENLEDKFSLSNKTEHLVETLKLVGDNQKFNQRWFQTLNKLIPEVQSILYKAVEESRERYVFDAHKSEVNSVAFSPNDQYAQYIVSGSRDKTVKLWDSSNQTLVHVHTFDGHQDSVNSVAFSPDGQYIVSGSSDNTVKLWDIENQKLLYTFEGHEFFVNSVAFSPDSQYIVSGSSDNTVKLWDINNKKLVHTFEGHKDSVNSVVFDPDGQYIVSGSDDNTIKLWDVENQVLLQTINSHEAAVISVDFSPDGKYIVSGSYDKTVKLWDVDNKKLVYSFNEYKGAIKSVSFSPDGQYIISGSNDKKLKLWHVEDQVLLHTYDAHESEVNSVGFSPDSKYIVSGSDDKKMKLWDADNKVFLHTFKGHKSRVNSVAISPDGQYIVSGSRDKTVKLWDVEDRVLLHTFDGHGHTLSVNSVAISPDGQYIVSGSRDKTVKLWDVEDRVLLHTFDGHKSEVNSVAFSPDGQYIVSGSLDKTVKLWDVKNQVLLHTFNGHEEAIIFNGHEEAIISVDFSPDGQYIVSGSLDKTVKLWDVKNKVILHTFNGHESGVNSVSFSPDSQYIVSGSLDKTVKLWDVKNKVILHTFNGHKEKVNSVAFSPDGQYIVSGSYDKTVKLWDVKNKVILHTFDGHESGVNSVAFSPDGQYIVSGSSDQKMKLWLGTGWQDWMAVGCKRIRSHPALVSAQEAATTCMEYGRWSDRENMNLIF